MDRSYPKNFPFTSINRQAQWAKVTLGCASMTATMLEIYCGSKRSSASSLQTYFPAEGIIYCITVDHTYQDSFLAEGDGLPVFHNVLLYRGCGRCCSHSETMISKLGYSWRRALSKGFSNETLGVIRRDTDADLAGTVPSLFTAPAWKRQL